MPDLALEVEFYHHVDSVISYPMEVLVCQSEAVELASIIFTILYGSPLIFQTDVQLTYIIYKLRIDPVNLVDVRETVAAEIHVTICQWT